MLQGLKALKTALVSGLNSLVGNVDPVASFSFVLDGIDATFTDLSTDADGAIVAWDWDFGDGGVSAVQNPTHEYTDGAGSYLVTLIVTDDEGATHQFQDTVEVTTADALDALNSAARVVMAMAAGGAAPSDPTAIFRFNATSGLEDLAGGDDDPLEYNAGIATVNAAPWGLCADLNSGDVAYWARFNSTGKFDLTTGGFALSLIGNFYNVGTQRFLFGKWLTKGWFLSMLASAAGTILPRLYVYGDTISQTGSSLVVAEGPNVITVKSAGAGAAMAAYAGASSATGTQPAGSITNLGRWQLQAPTPAGPPADVAMSIYWHEPATAPTQTHHNNLRAFLGL